MTAHVVEKEKQNLLQEFMLEEFLQFAPTLHKYQWPWEGARWQWLVFCLIERIDDSAEATAIARETVEIFTALDLLEIDALAQLASEKGELDYQQKQLALMLNILERQGYDVDEAKTIVTSICEAARALKDRYEGKVQKYLRKYGELMLEDLAQTFSFSRLSQEDVRYAFTHWLQDVANMPLVLSHSAVKVLCEKLNASLEDLVEDADRNDVNLALVDDWAVDYLEREPQSEESQT